MLFRCCVTARSVGARLNAFAPRPLTAGSCCGRAALLTAAPRPGQSSGGDHRWQPYRARGAVETAGPSGRRHMSGARPPQTPPEDLPAGEKPPSVFQRFRNVAKKYWYIVLPVHLVTSTAWFGLFYFVSSSGVDVPALLGWLGFPEWIVDKVKNGHSWKSHVIIAYGLYKIFTPLRYMVTLGGTGMTIRYLKKFGYAVGSSKKP